MNNLETYTPLDTINSSLVYSPLGYEQDFSRRIINDEFKSLPPKVHLIRKLQKKTRSYGGYYINFYKQFTIEGHSNGVNFITPLIRSKGNDITVKDFKRFFKEMGFKVPSKAKKEYFLNEYLKYLST